VIREGKREEVEIWELVPDDIVLMNAGEHVPGDGELIESNKLSVNEAILTGESETVTKSVDPEHTRCSWAPPSSPAGIDESYADRPADRTRADRAQPAAAHRGRHPAPNPAEEFSQLLTYIVIGFTLLILTVGVLMGGEFLDMLRTSIILAIAAVPEGLLIAVTVILVLACAKS